jgi:hypothetical protein
MVTQVRANHIIRSPLLGQYSPVATASACMLAVCMQYAGGGMRYASMRYACDMLAAARPCGTVHRHTRTHGMRNAVTICHVAG